MLRIRVLGALGADLDGTPLALGAPRQRAVLALLVLARGGVVPVERMADLLWRGRPPAKAAASLQVYVSHLRRALEPGRPPRAPATLLVSAPPGYALTVPPETVDAWRFEQRLTEARGAPPERARALLAEALPWWRGPAFAEHADEEWAAPEATRLAGLLDEAQELAVAAELGTGRAAPAVTAAEALVRRHPLREEGWRLLALAQWACARQADALDSLRRATATLHEELGCDPGPGLVELERALLGGRVEVLRAATGRTPGRTRSAGSVGGDTLNGVAAHGGSVRGDEPHTWSAQAGPSYGESRREGGPGGGVPKAVATQAGSAQAGFPARSSANAGVRHVPSPRAGFPDDLGTPNTASTRPGSPHADPPPPQTPRPATLFVGRDAELRALDRAAHDAGAGGGVVLVAGEAGAGKSALVARFGEGLRAAGWRVAVGCCPETEGAPPAWAWAEALAALAADVALELPAELAPLLRPGAGGGAGAGGDAPARAAGDVTAGRFRMHLAFTAWLRRAAAYGPLAVVLEDLHRADDETLALLEGAAALSGVPVLTVGSYRPAEAAEGLVKTLAALAPRAPHRVALGGLDVPAVAALVTSVCGRPVDPRTVAVLAERTGGNPFYVRESARLLADEGALVAVGAVPQGVRDVLRRRLALLPEATRTALRLAAAAGLESETTVLATAAEGPVAAAGVSTGAAVLDGLDSAVAAGLLTEPAPGRVRFVHALVRDTVYTDLSVVRRSGLHAALAKALRRHHPADLAALAHHFAHSGAPGDAPLAVDYAVRAADAAERRYAHDVAVELLEQAVAVRTAAAGEHDADRPDPAVRLLVRLLGAQLRAGATDAALRTRQRAVDLAERADRDDLAATVYAAWTEPAPWRSRLEGFQDPAALDRLRRLAARPDLNRPTRARLLQALCESAAVDAPARAAEAAYDQLRLARTEGEPRLLAAALMTTARLLPHETQAARRGPFVTELRELADRQDLPGYRWFCEHADTMAAGARNDPRALRVHLAEGRELARRYRMVWAQGLTVTTTAMLETIAGRFDAAEAAYTAAAEVLQRVGARHAPGMRTLGVVLVALARGDLAGVEKVARAVYAEAGEPTGVLLALVLAHLGKHDESHAVRFRHEPVADHLYGVELDLRARLAVLRRDTAAAARLLPLLRPVREQLAGAAGAAYATRPLAHALADLHMLLGDERAAAENYALAERTALAWESKHLTMAARRALAPLTAAR